MVSNHSRPCKTSYRRRTFLTTTSYYNAGLASSNLLPISTFSLTPTMPPDRDKQQPMLPVVHLLMSTTRSATSLVLFMDKLMAVFNKISPMGRKSDSTWARPCFSAGEISTHYRKMVPRRKSALVSSMTGSWSN